MVQIPEASPSSSLLSVLSSPSTFTSTRTSVALPNTNSNSTHTQNDETIACSFTCPVSSVPWCIWTSMTHFFDHLLTYAAARRTNAAAKMNSLSSSSLHFSVQMPISGRLSSTSSSSAFVTVLWHSH